MGYGRLWVKRGMGYKGFDCTLNAIKNDFLHHLLVGSQSTVIDVKTCASPFYGRLYVVVFTLWTFDIRFQQTGAFRI